MAEMVPESARRWPVQKRSRDRLERVLRVAESLIVERGFANLNMREIAEIANVNISTIYAYFPNSQSLLRALSLNFIRDSERRAKEVYGRISDVDTPPEKKVDELIDVVIESYRANDSWNAIWRGMQSDNELLAMDIDDTKATSLVLSSYLVKINPALADEADITALIMTAINGAVIRLASELSVREREAIYSQLRRLVRRMLIF